MKKNGFTLIELLAVIVILAIIALIATPIILGIINDAREKANERSVELYASAVRNAMAAYQLKKLNAPTKFSDLDIQYDGEVVCETEELYEDGSFYIAGCTVNGNVVDYTYGIKQETEEVGSLNTVCEPESVATPGLYTMGDVYTCEVKEGVSYTFYVLSTTEASVNLIMDSNVKSDGTPVKDATDLGLVAYNSIGDAAGTGPVTAMEYLNNATSSWTNIPNLNETYDDEGGNFTSFVITGQARLPYLSEIEATGCVQYEEGTCPLWMTNYLEAYITSYPNRTAVSRVYGYWTFSSYAPRSFSAWFVSNYGYFSSDYGVDEGSVYGVRPVISLSI